MKDEEKNLIENLFHRLKNTELKSSEKDIAADNLIQVLVKKQPSSSYYMAQTILVQETAIKKMSEQIEELKKRIETFNTEEKDNKPSFLSSFFNKKKPITQQTSNDSLWRNKEKLPYSNNSTVLPTTQIPPTASISNNNSSGFLSNALQTATGVAGGMILGNMLMNIFNHSKPEEEIFDTINTSSTDYNHSEENIFHENMNNNLVDYEYHDEDSNLSELNSDRINNNINNIDNIDNIDETDMNDDNFI